MDAESLVTIVSSVGFPIAITIYVMVRLESKMDALRTALDELNLTIKSQHK